MTVDELFEKMDQKINDLDKKMDQKINGLDKKMNKKFNNLETQMTDLRNDMNNNFEKINNKLDGVTNSNLAQILTNQIKFQNKINSQIRYNELEHKKLDCRISELELRKYQYR